MWSAEDVWRIVSIDPVQEYGGRSRSPVTLPNFIFRADMIYVLSSRL